MAIDHLSASSVGTYMKCPKRWRYHYVDKIKPDKTSVHLVFGSVIHNTIERYISSKRPPLAKPFDYHWNAKLQECGEVEYYGDDQKSYEELGKNMLTSKSVIDTFCEMKPFCQGELPMIEHYLEFDIDGVSVPIIGCVDIVESDKIAVDLKTSSRQWRVGREYEGLQPPLYVLGLQTTGFDCQNKFRYYVLVKKAPYIVQRIEFGVSPRWIERTVEQVRHVWRGIQASAFPECDASCWWCSKKRCDYYEICKS